MALRSDQKALVSATAPNAAAANTATGAAAAAAETPVIEQPSKTLKRHTFQDAIIGNCKSKRRKPDDYSATTSFHSAPRKPKAARKPAAAAIQAAAEQQSDAKEFHLGTSNAAVNAANNANATAAAGAGTVPALAAPSDKDEKLLPSVTIETINKSAEVPTCTISKEDFHLYGRLIAHGLTQTIEKNAKTLPEIPSVFCCQAIPKISMRDYIHRYVEHEIIQPSSLILSMSCLMHYLNSPNYQHIDAQREKAKAEKELKILHTEMKTQNLTADSIADKKLKLESLTKEYRRDTLTKKQYADKTGEKHGLMEALEEMDPTKAVTGVVRTKYETRFRELKNELATGKLNPTEKAAKEIADRQILLSMQQLQQEITTGKLIDIAAKQAEIDELTETITDHTILIDQLSKARDRELTVFNVHRLFATSVLVASKLLQEHLELQNNASHANCAGIPLSELNALERAFMRRVNNSFPDFTETSFKSDKAALEKAALALRPKVSAVSMFVPPTPHSTQRTPSPPTVATPAAAAPAPSPTGNGPH